MKSRKVGYYLERTTRIVKLKFTQIFNEAGLDITPEQWVILDSLHHKDGLSQVDLATQSYKNAPTVSRIIDLLEKKALVERRRDEADRRVIKVFITDAGHELYTKIFPQVKALRKQSWEGLSEEDYEQFLRIINKVFSNMDSHQ